MSRCDMAFTQFAIAVYVIHLRTDNLSDVLHYEQCSIIQYF